VEFVAGGLDDDQLHPAARMALEQLGLHPAGLGQGQDAAPGADADGDRIIDLAFSAGLLFYRVSLHC
jgi:hypothetical protein